MGELAQHASNLILAIIIAGGFVWGYLTSDNADTPTKRILRRVLWSTVTFLGALTLAALYFTARGFVLGIICLVTAALSAFLTWCEARDLEAAAANPAAAYAR